MVKRWNHHSFAHKMVADLQVTMAHELYEVLAKNDEFHKDWPHRSAWVNRIAPTLRDEARSVLSEMLARHDVSDEDKSEIYNALLLDRTIPNEDRVHLPVGEWIN